jgi:hypothetical protein
VTPRAPIALALFLLQAPLHADEDELARARFLDQQGVRAFAEGRTRDAMTLFSESYRAGGPPTELWNLARCQLKLEDAEGARRTLETYLDQKNLLEDDRAEGKRLLDEIQHRSSTFVVASTPQGALVTVDGHVVGMTPYTSTLPPGPHEVKVARDGAGSMSRHLDAHDGRPIVISVDLGPSEHGPKALPGNKEHVRRFSTELGLYGVISVLGGGAVVEGGPSPEVSFGYAPFTYRRALLGFGLRVRASVDSWTTTNVSNSAIGCSPPTNYSAAEIVAMPTVFAALRVSQSVSLGARLGIGAAIYASGQPIGGDLFAPACAYGGSLTADGYAALDISLRLTTAIRLVLLPATFDIHPGWVGTRSDANLDASGPWVRLGLGFAFAVDL